MDGKRVNAMELQEILDCLRQMNSLHDELLELGSQKNQVLIKNRVDELSAIVRKEAKLIKQVSETEQLWQKAIADFLRSHGNKPVSDFTVSALAGMLSSQEEKNKLRGAQQALMNRIDKLKRVNETNQQLIEQSLAFVNYSLELITDAPQQDVVYHKPATTPSKSARGFFDRRA